MDRKKIAFVHHAMVMGGAEKAFIELLKSIDYTRYEVTVWLENDRGELHSQLDPRVEIRLWEPFICRDYWPLFRDLLRRGRLVSAAGSVLGRGLSRRFRNDSFKNLKYHLLSLAVTFDGIYDAVIGVNALNSLPSMIALYAFPAKKRLVWLHGLSPHVMPAYEPIPLEPVLDGADGIICVSEAVREAMYDTFPALRGKAEVIYDLIDLREIREKADEEIPERFDRPVLVTVSRLTKEKGIDLIPPAAKLLRESGLDFRWLVIGYGICRKSIEKLIEQFGVSDCVSLPGTRMNPYPYIAGSTVYVQPSYSEGFCLSALEAKTLEKPVVATEMPALQELFDEDEYVLCEASPASLAEGISGVLRGETAIQNRTRLDEAYNREQLRRFCDFLEK